MCKGFPEGRNPCNRKAVTVTADSWTAPDGTMLGYKVWSSGAPSRGLIVALHGLSCREDDFIPLAEAAAARDLRVAAWNLRGQGLDPQVHRRGSWLDLEGILIDLKAFIDFVAKPGEPIFLCGDSMGALLALQAAVTKPWPEKIAGLLLFSPVVGLAQKNPAWLKSLLIAISRLAPDLRLKPSWFVHGKSTAPQLTRVAERQLAVINAPHRLGPTTIGFLASMGDLIDGATPAAGKLAVPLTVFSAGHDTFVTPEQVRDFFARVRSTDKTHFHYPESYHQLLFDLDAPAVLADAITWIEAHLPSRH